MFLSLCFSTMEKKTLQEERNRNRKVALEEHARLHKLFVEDRLSFERERKRILDDFLNSIDDEDKKERLIALQKSWDKRMRNAGSVNNRLVLAKTFFWSHFHETWQPAIQEFNEILNGKADERT